MSRKPIKARSDRIEPLSFGRPISVAILYYAGTKEDDEDTIQCANGIEKSLKRLGHKVKKIRVTKKNWRKAADTPADVVFNLVEDERWNLYINIALRLERLGRAQVGQNKKGLRYVVRKAWVKQRMKRMGISTPAFRVMNRRSTIANFRGLTYPLIIKPSRQHAGIGISQDSVVNTEVSMEKQVKHLFSTYPGEVIAEEFVKGREIHVTIMGNGRNLAVLPYCEIGFGGKFKNNWNIYTYEAKWDQKTWEYWDARVEAPAKISSALYKKIKKLAFKAFRAFDCCDIARLDIRVDANETPYIVDVNMNPSINYYDEEDATLTSVYALGWSYDQFIETISAIAYKRLAGSLKSSPLSG